MKKTLTLLAIILATSACNSKSLKNDELMEAHKKEQAVKAQLKDCMCVKMYMPVCGKNKVTYGNVCEANCAGQKEYTMGTCESQK